MQNGHRTLQCAILILLDTNLKSRLLDFFSLDRQTVAERFDPHIHIYYRKQFGNCDDAAGFIRWCACLAKACSSKGGEMLDAGCGFGLTCFAFAASDEAPRRITGLDPSEGKINAMRRIGGFLGVGEERVLPVVGDAMSLGFDDGSFDTVFVKDVASHVRDRAKFFSETARVLKPGGRMLLTDENNSFNLAGLSARRRLWVQNERGPLPGDAWMSETYYEMRRRIICEIRPELPEGAVDELAADSMGMWGDELRDAVRDYRPDAGFRNTSDFAYRHPVSGEYMEYPLNPFRLSKELGDYGFRARTIRPVFATMHPLKSLAGSVIAAMHPLSIIVQPSFYILAVKL